ncbi:MAG: aldehyde dehydrogenase [Geminicoccaceae bacterium]
MTHLTLLIGAAAMAALLGQPAYAASEYTPLVAAPGAEETFVYCGSCHSVQLVAQQGLDRDHWNELFEWMVEEQGMEPIEEPDRSLILDYLAKHYNEDRPNFPN